MTKNKEKLRTSRLGVDGRGNRIWQWSGLARIGLALPLERALGAKATFFRAWRTGAHARWSWRSNVRTVGLVHEGRSAFPCPRQTDRASEQKLAKRALIFDEGLVWSGAEVCHGAARKTPPGRRGKRMAPRLSYRLSTSTSTPGRRSLSRISTPGSRRRFRSSIMTSSRSRRSRPTVALGSRVQVVEQAGPTQFLSHTSSAPTGMESTAEPARAAARVNA